MPRILSFDYIRVIALLGILTCHSLFLFKGFDWAGRYLAQCFNFVFLILSAFLLGMSWEKHDRQKYTKDFLVHRFSKLSWSYYPFLIVLFVFLSAVGYHYSVKDVAMYMAYLAWFDKIPGFGHVWFLTMIAFAYIGVFAFSLFYNCSICQKSFSAKILWLNWIILILTILILHFCITKAGLPGYMVLYLALYIIVFRYSAPIIQTIGKISIAVLISLMLITHGASLFAYKHGLFGNMYISPIVGIINGLTFFALAFRVLQLCRQNRAIAFVSGISFEIYLMHEFFLYNRGVYNLNYPPRLTI